jgi:SAM-dependent MidA family methyltransferase
MKIIREEIERDGPMPFSRFMELALYDPHHGYYRRNRDPFGKHGDFYTAEQLQPVFGVLIRRLVDQLLVPGDVVVELGAGRREMAEHFSGLNYVPIDISCGSIPDRFSGIVFANEFFDALPVEVAVFRRGLWRQMCVDLHEEKFTWIGNGPVSTLVEEYLARFGPDPEEEVVAEINLDALAWIDDLDRRIERGRLIAIDYGYTQRELVRFPQGTLMSYRRHLASPDVLDTPGERDITAHVNFTAMIEHAGERGFQVERFESLGQTLLDTGEADQFASALEAPGGTMQQLKTLLFGMGESFRTLILKKDAPK